jgi:hypothetical protein
MKTQLQVVLLGKVHHAVGIGPVELAGLARHAAPLVVVLRHDPGEVPDDDGIVGGAVRSASRKRNRDTDVNAARFG